MKHFAILTASALSLAFAAPAVAQNYSGGSGTFTGIGADEAAFPGTPFDTVTFTPDSGVYTGPGNYALNEVSFEVGVNRTAAAPFSGVFTLTGLFGGTPFTYDVNYTGTIDTSDTITLGGNHINVLGTDVWLRPLTLAGGVGTYTGTLIAAVGVPEPATWGLMIAGFGAVGFAMRRRNVATAVRYA